MSRRNLTAALFALGIVAGVVVSHLSDKGLFSRTKTVGLEQLAADLDATDPRTRFLALSEMKQFERETAKYSTRVVELLDDDDKRVRNAAASLVEEFGDHALGKKLKEAVLRKDKPVSFASASNTLGKLLPRQEFHSLVKMILMGDYPEPLFKEVGEQSTIGIPWFNKENDNDLFEHLLKVAIDKQSTPISSLVALRVLSGYEWEKGVQKRAVTMLNSNDPDQRASGAYLVYRLRTEREKFSETQLEQIKALLKIHRNDQNEKVRKEAAKTLEWLEWLE